MIADHLLNASPRDTYRYISRQAGDTFPDDATAITPYRRINDMTKLTFAWNGMVRILHHRGYHRRYVHVML